MVEKALQLHWTKHFGDSEEEIEKRQGTQRIVLGASNSMSPRDAARQQPGRVFLRRVAKRKPETLRRVDERTALPGTEVWTDDCSSHSFLTAAGCRHISVNH